MLNARWSVILLCCIFCSLTSCNRKHHNVSRGFYYWKTTYKPTQFELTSLHDLGVKKLYVRLFDVDHDNALNKAIPIAPIKGLSRDTGCSYVPVVFITQKAIIALNETSITQLAQSICALTEGMCTEAGIRPDELQIDCDWTSGTKDKYFSLLKVLKEIPWMKGKTLSCTIRLNQVKYTVHNGIPPADKGLVMCYGMGDLKKQGPVNSILNADETKDYLKHLDTYPIPVDIALPIFEWCVLFRDQQFKGILHDVPTDAVMHSSLFKLSDHNLYTCLHDSVWQGYTLKTNDIIRVEKPSYEDILSVAAFSSQKINNTDINVIFFDCDSITLKKISKNDLETICDSYR
jgi:hypothetical protein